MDIARRFLSRGGFNAAKSKYINDKDHQKDESFEEQWNNVQEEQKEEGIQLILT